MLPFICQEYMLCGKRNEKGELLRFVEFGDKVLVAYECTTYLNVDGKPGLKACTIVPGYKDGEPVPAGHGGFCFHRNVEIHTVRINDRKAEVSAALEKEGLRKPYVFW